ncbi:EVE domain-containing protein [Sphaerotilus microaerophilus]|uniref:EVE domain-containing protein n=2 Tax=Sphaerotilus microaerophilus TaxID=2914710 RepID=A0ABN6PM61_9BURK|nr:EVE domain-containing protein [Sphaerotilus sp. FB-5]
MASPSPFPSPLPCDGDDDRVVEPRHWLMKIEPDECSIDELARLPGQTVAWTGVRNYQARNFMRDAMRIGDGVLYYHSSCPEPGIAGLAEVASPAYPDATQFDAASPYFDPKASPAAPRWLHVDVRFVRRTRQLGLAELRSHPELAGMALLRPGNRLSITPVTLAEWQAVLALLGVTEPA